MRARNLQRISDLLVLLVVLTGRLWGQTNEPPARIAIITEAGEFSAVADLLTVELSAKPHLQTLERAQIETVYREQGLSVANRDYVKLGQVLGAEGLLLLGATAEGTNKFVSVRLVAVKPGVVIGNVRTPWPVPDAAEWARWVANHFTPLLPKLGVSAKDAIPISVVNVRSAVRTTEAEELERQLTALIIERLTRERELFVLERRRMDLLTEEKELKDVSESAFWNGRYLLDGIIDRDGYAKDRLTLNARLASPKADRPVVIELEGARTNLSEVINRLAEKVREGLALKATGTAWDPADEADAYFEEAKWALKWRMLKEAQAASEASWALGRRSKETSELRIRSYREATVCPINNTAFSDPTGNAYAPEVDQLAPAIHALELYLEGFGAFLANDDKPDTNWHALALETLSSTAELLRKFYYHPEARVGRDDALQDLRQLARDTVLAVENQPCYRPLSPKHTMFLHSDRDLYLEETPSLAHVELGVGAFWRETPEECLAAYRKHASTDALHRLRGYFAEPVLVGWRAEDRQRGAALWRGFVQELCASTNPITRVEGVFQAYAAARYDSGKELQARKLLYKTAVENAPLFDDAGLAEGLRADIASLVPHSGDREEAALEAAFNDEFRRAIEVAWKQSVVSALKSYLLTNSAYSNAEFNALLHPKHKYYRFDKTDADELTPLIENYQSRIRARAGEDFYGINGWRQMTNVLRELDQRLQEAAAPRPVPQREARKPEPRTPSPDPKNPLRVTRFWPMPVDDEDFANGYVETSIVQTCFRNGRLWMLVRTGMPVRRAVIFGVDPRTLETETIKVPLDKIGLGTGLEVLGDALYVSQPGKLSRYRMGSKAWEDLPLPLERLIPKLFGDQIDMSANIVRPAVANGRLIIATVETIMELGGNGGDVKVLASRRRRPALNMLDSLDAYYTTVHYRNELASVFEGPNQSVRAVIQSKVYTHDQEKGGWSESLTLPPSPNWFSFVSFPEGSIFQQGTADQKTRWWLLPRDLSSLELLLTEGAFSRLGAFSKRPPNQPLDDTSLSQKPRWHHPRDVLLVNSPLCLDGDSVWLFAGAMTFEADSSGRTVLQEQDGHHAVLVKFEKNQAEAQMTPLRFDLKGPHFMGLVSRLRSSGKGNQRPTSNGLQYECPLKPTVFLPTPQGLIVTAEPIPGFWIVPTTSSEAQANLTRESANRQDPATVLFGAIEAGNLAMAKEAFARGAVADGRNEWGQTPLMLAAKGGNLELVNLLIEKGADVNAKSTSRLGSPVLSFAAEGNSPLVLKSLLAHGADFKVRDNRGTTALFMAAATGKKEAAEVFISKGASLDEFGGTDDLGNRLTPLMGAARAGHLGIVELLLAKGAELDRKNNNGVTALMETAKSEHSAVLKLLITKGADVNAKGIHGHTALIFASFNRRLENVKLLLEAGANPDATAADDDDPDAKRYDASKFATPEIYDLIQDAKNKAKQRQRKS